MFGSRFGNFLEQAWEIVLIAGDPDKDKCCGTVASSEPLLAAAASSYLIRSPAPPNHEDAKHVRPRVVILFRVCWLAGMRHASP